MTHTYAAIGSTYAGDVSGALGHAAAIMAIAESISDPRVSTYGLMTRASVLAPGGRHDEALESVNAALQLAPEPSSRAYASAALGYVYLEMGEAAHSAALLERAVTTFEAFQLRPWVGLYGGYLADARRLIGNLAGARTAADHALRVATSCGHPFSLGWSIRSLGRVATAEGETNVARGHLEKARGIFSAMGAALELERTVRELNSLKDVGHRGAR